MTIPSLPNLAPNGVIQNPGIGQILGGGLSQLAQFLQQKQQQEQQAALAQAQMAQQQQRIDLERSGQQFNQDQARMAEQAAMAEQLRQRQQQEAVGGALQQIMTPQTFTTDMTPPGQIGGPSFGQGYQLSTTTTPTDAAVMRGMQPQDINALTASPGYKSIIDQREKDAKARLDQTEIAFNPISGQTTMKYGGASVGEAPTKPNEVSADMKDALFFLGKRSGVDPAAMSPAQREQAYKMSEALASLRSAKPDFGQMMAAAAVPKLVELAQKQNEESVGAKDDLYNVKRALKFSEDMTNGVGANAVVALQSTLAKFGIGDAQSATNAQDFLQATAARIIPLPKGLTRLTNQELEFLKTMKGADITKNPANIARILNDAKIYDEDVIARNNRAIQSSPLDERLKQGYIVDPAFEEEYNTYLGKTKPSGLGGKP